MRKILFLLMFPFLVFAQGYISYFTGNTINITTPTSLGICLMGGATENDNAMKWLLQKANGGDIVVLRSTGTNGYKQLFVSHIRHQCQLCWNISNYIGSRSDKSLCFK